MNLLSFGTCSQVLHFLNNRGGNFQNSRGFHNQRGYRGNNRGRSVEMNLIFYHENFPAEVEVIINMKGGVVEEGEAMTR